MLCGRRARQLEPACDALYDWQAAWQSGERARATRLCVGGWLRTPRLQGEPCSDLAISSSGCRCSNGQADWGLVHTSTWQTPSGERLRVREVWQDNLNEEVQSVEHAAAGRNLGEALTHLSAV